MKAIAYLAAGLSLAAVATASSAQVSVSIGEPGFYGSINIGNAPPPPLVYPNPVIIQPVPAPLPPMYLYVPPEHRMHWREYCARYGACGRPVYFVDRDWYHRVYVPHYRSHRWEYERREDRREERREERRDDRHDHGRWDHDRRD